MTIARISVSQAAYLALAGLLLVSSFLFFNAMQSRADVGNVTLTSHGTSSTMAKAGDTVVLSFTATSSTTPMVLIDGHSVIAGTMSNGAWTAQYALAPSDPAGLVNFAITTDTGTQTATTDGSYVVYFPAQPFANFLSVNVKPGAVTGATSLPIVAVFSEPVTNVTAASFVTTNASVSSVQAMPGSQVYLITLMPITAGNFTVTLPANQVTDVAGNGNSGSAMLSYTFTPGAAITAPPETTTVTVPAENSGSMTASTGSDDMMGMASDTMASTSSTSSSTGTTSPSNTTAVWIGTIIIILLLIGGGWWYSRNVTPSAE